MIWKIVSRSHITLVVGMMSLCLTVGCGGNLASVSGSVTFDGQPVEEGEIRFIPASNQGGQGSPQVAGATIAQGKYDVPADKGAVPGTYRVEIRAEKKTGKKILAVPPAPPGSMIEITEQFVPAKYNEQSTLTLEITAGSNSKDFELTK